MIKTIINKLVNKKIAILGFGTEGQSTYNFIREYEPNMPISILDQNDNLKTNPDLINDQNLTIITGADYLNHLGDYDLIIKSPGISLKDIDTTDISNKITSQIQLLLEVNREKVIGITGTKGKSTTSSLIYEIIKKEKKNVILVGNIGTPVFSVLDTCNKDTIFVIEMSSHQLEFLSLSPHIGIILNLFEDHLDHAGTVKHYHNIKLKMFSYQQANDIMIYCNDNITLDNLIKTKEFKSKVYTVSINNQIKSDVYIKNNTIYFQNKVLCSSTLKRNLLGQHNLENIMVVLTISEILNLNLANTLDTIANFKPLAYRLENIGIVNDVEYYLDTLATIPEATIEAVETLKNVNTLIFGGMDRGISYNKLVDYLSKCTIENLICMPTTGHKIADILSKNNTYKVTTLEEAVELAKKVTKKNTICLLSPAASSYEQFKNYQEKGDKFKEYIYK